MRKELGGGGGVLLTRKSGVLCTKINQSIHNGDQN